MSRSVNTEILDLKYALQRQVRRSLELDKELHAARVRLAAFERALGGPEEAAHWQYMYTMVKAERDWLRADAMAEYLAAKTNPLASNKDVEKLRLQEALDASASW